MSLSIPFALESAVETAPDATVDVAGTSMTIAQLARRVDTLVRHLADTDDAKSGTLRLPPIDETEGLCRALAAASLGLVLTDSDTDTGTPASAGTSRDAVWSGSPLARIGDRTVTHGEVVERSGRPASGVPASLAPLAALVAALTGAGIRTSHDAI